MIYAEFESVRKLSGCEPSQEGSFTVKTEKHEACGSWSTIIRSVGATSGPRVYRGIDEAYMFVVDTLQDERWLRSLLAEKKPLAMTCKDGQAHRGVREYHICNKSLFKDLFLDSMPVHDHDTGSNYGQSHRRCYYEAIEKINFIGPKRERKEREHLDQ